MLKYALRLVGLLVIVCLQISVARSQSSASKTDLLKLIDSVKSAGSKLPVEKLYLQFDKPNYNLDDTIWFKCYLLNAKFLEPSERSGILYVEIANGENKVVKRVMVPVAHGLSWSNLTLDSKEFVEGNYTVRAYTNWMRNFGEDFVFKKDFYFGRPDDKSLLVETNLNTLKETSGDSVKLSLTFRKLNNEPLILNDFNIDVDGEKGTVFNTNATTNLNGKIAVNFSLKKKADHLKVIATDLNKTTSYNKIVLPVTVSTAGNMDLQFLPEGGNLVAGLPARVGFKAIDRLAKGVETAGDILDGKQQSVCAFKSLHKGMGTFNLVPQAGENYTARVKLTDGTIKTYALPAIESTGSVLKVRRVITNDSLVVTILSTLADKSYYLVGLSRGEVCYASVISLNNNAASIKIPTSFFPTGIARFTLLSGKMLPLNDRLAFIDHADNLHFAFTPATATFKTRDSISLQVRVTDKDGNPAKGNFSLSVTDNKKVKTDSAENIMTHLLLTSDLKGNLEDPAYYFNKKADGNTLEALDNLMLTQGWVGYDWKDLLHPTNNIAYQPEQDFVIKGKVTTFTDKPIADTHVFLLSPRTSSYEETITEKDGQFEFKNIVPLDTPVYLINTTNKRGKSFNLNIAVDEFQPPVFKPSVNAIQPWYVNTDSTVLTNANSEIAGRKERETITTGEHVLKEVVITAKKTIKGSQNVNGSGNADLVIDQDEVEKAGKKTLLQLLQEKVPGFKEGFMLLAGPSHKATENRNLAGFIIDQGGIFDSGQNQDWYYINNKPVKFIIDGISLYQVIPMEPPAINNINDYLNAHNAEDIKGIEVSSSSKYAAKYVPVAYNGTVLQSDMAFVEITTRSGAGPGITKNPGVYLYKPLPYTLPKKFYQPKYNPDSKITRVNDARSTIYWDPNCNTDNQGRANLSFLSPVEASSYTLTIEGIGGNNNLGSCRYEVWVGEK